MISEEHKRTDRVQKYCTYCGQPFIGGKDDSEKCCEEHRGD